MSHQQPYNPMKPLPGFSPTHRTTMDYRYTSPYLVATPQGYTKHYYAESERVASRIGGGGLADIAQTVVNMEDFLENIWVGEVQPVWDEVDMNEYFVNRQGEIRNHLTDAMMCAGEDPLVEEDLLISLRSHWREISDESDFEPDCYWYHSDHLGSSSWITHTDGSAVQHLHYLPWGEDFVDQRLTGWAAPHTFSAKERDPETDFSYFGSRYYSSDLSIWLSVDPQASKYPSLSPYVYCADNPVKLVDPNGESTQVVDNGDGTYTVVGGNVKDGDNGIYLRKSDGSNGKLLAYSATPESFYNSETGEFKGRIDPNNQKGRNFLNNKVLKSGLLSYMIKARPEGPYDFKRTDGTNSVKYTTVDEFYRGMPIGEINGLPIWASARDVGNIAAGLVAGINGFSWDASRLAFDCLESIKDYNDTGIIGFSKESSSTQYAQRLGFMIGSTIYYNKTIKELSRLPSYGEYISKKLKPIPKPIIR